MFSKSSELVHSLSEKERLIHEHGLVSVLKQIHDELDAAVFDAYGWPHDLSDEEILRRLVDLNRERAEEEKRGIIRWLRPEFQNPEGTQAATATQGALPIEPEAPEASPAVAGAKRPWPRTLPEQAQAVRAVLAEQPTGLTPEQLARLFLRATPSASRICSILWFRSAKPVRWREIDTSRPDQFCADRQRSRRPGLQKDRPMIFGPGVSVNHERCRTPWQQMNRKQDMDQITVADLGVEGGGLTIYRKQAEGSWSFWTKGSPIALDENDDEDWRYWTTDPVADLSPSFPPIGRSSTPWKSIPSSGDGFTIITRWPARC